MDPFFGDEPTDEELIEIIKESLDAMISLGFVEVVGIDENGEWLYKATEKGIEYYKKRYPE